MIRLEIEPYCHACPKFEAYVDKMYIIDNEIDTKITCEFAATCRSMMDFLKSYENEEGKE